MPASSPPALGCAPEAVYMRLEMRDSPDRAAALAAILPSPLLWLACDARNITAVWPEASALPTELVVRLRELETVDTFVVREDLALLHLEVDSHDLGALAQRAHIELERRDVPSLETLILSPRIAWLVGRWHEAAARAALEQALADSRES